MTKALSRNVRGASTLTYALAAGIAAVVVAIVVALFLIMPGNPTPPQRSLNYQNFIL